MRVLIPYDARNPKTRLSPLFEEEERAEFARVMLKTVLRTVDQAGHDPTVLATAPLDCDWPVVVDGDCSIVVDRDWPVVVDDRPLSVAVNDVLDDWDTPLCIIMADLPLVTVEAVDRLLDQQEDVVIAPGLGGGTNALVIRHPEFRVDYHGTSYRDHRNHAQECGASVSTVDSFRLAVDIDDPDDLVEVLLHGQGEVTDWLADAGVRLSETASRTTIERV